MDGLRHQVQLRSNVATPRSTTKHTPEKVAHLRSMRAAGISYAEAAKELDITVGTIFRWLNPDAYERYLSKARIKYATDPEFRKKCQTLSRNDWARRQVDSFVYVIFFPTTNVLKVGKSTDSREYESRARTILKTKGFAKTREGTTIWKFPGDVRTEAYVQVMLAFRLKSMFNKERRLSEWFLSNGMSSTELVALLNEIVKCMPEDQVDSMEVCVSLSSIVG